MTEWIDAGASTTRLPSEADLRLSARGTKAARDLATLARRIPPTLARARDHAPGQPQAASYDGIIVTGSRSQMWCFVHERDLSACHRSDEPCDGTPVTVSDPTGEAALGLDPERDAMRRITSAIARIEGDLRGLLAELDSLTVVRAPNDNEQQNVKADPGCESCARTKATTGKPRWEPVYRDTDPGGNLGRAWPLCSWCWRWVVDTGVLPTERQVKDHHDGKRMMRPA